jgi:hypothetical protein
MDTTIGSDAQYAATSDDTDADTEGGKQAIYTSTGATEGSHSLPEMGWSTEGMQEFNALYAK